MPASLPQLFVIGDSISMHYGPYLAQYLAGHYTVARRADDDAKTYNLDIPTGTNNGDSRMVRTYLAALEQSAAFHPSVLLLNAGLHDIKTDPHTAARQIPAAEYTANLHAIAAIASRLRDRHGTRVAWLTTTPADEAVHNTPGRPFHRFAADVIACNTTAHTVMPAAGIPILDLFTFTQSVGMTTSGATGQALYCDHVHFPDWVRQLQAAHIAGWVMGRFS